MGSGNLSASALVGYFLLLLCLQVIYRRITNPLARIPGPEVSKWTGLVYKYHLLRGRIPVYIHSLHEKYGPIVRFSPGEVDICDVNAKTEIYKTNSRFLKSSFYRRVVANSVQNVFSTTDPQFHAARRRLLASPISDSSLTRLEPLVNSRVCLAISRIAEEMERRGAADVFKWWLFMATDIIGELSFGDSFRMLESGKKNQYTLDLEQIAALQAVRVSFPWLTGLVRYLPLPAYRNVYEAAKRIQSYSWQSINRYKRLLAENPSDPKPTLFSKLFDTDKCGLSDDAIRQEAQSYIIAGSDTTAVTLTYLIYSVCRDNRVRNTLVAELTDLPDALADRDLRDLPYLGQVIDETLRLYSAVPSVLPRAVPPEGAQFNGYYVPGGCTVATQAYSLHRDPKTFPDPLCFKPERWASPTKQMKDASLPFGGGSRICLGMHLARMELRLATALFFRTFPTAQLSTKEDMTEDDMTMKAFFLMAPKGHRCLIDVEPQMA